MTTSQNNRKLRRITARELADLSSYWENSLVDTNKYYQTCLNVWEVDQETYELCKREGNCCQIHDDRFYIGY